MLRRTLAIVVLVLTAGMAAAEEPQRWLNVDVAEAGDTSVKVRLPLGMVLALLDAVNTKEMARGRVDLHLEDADVDWPAVLRAVRSAPDGEFVQIESKDADVRVGKRAGTLHITVREDTGDERVEVTLPEVLIDALVIEDNRLDLKALLTQLDRLPGGELVRVTSADTNVRIWVE